MGDDMTTTGPLDLTIWELRRAVRIATEAETAADAAMLEAYEARSAAVLALNLALGAAERAS